jgi:hypothetical protein
MYDARRARLEGDSFPSRAPLPTTALLLPVASQWRLWSPEFIQ